ncbi:MAG: signal peptide peptidase SppA, partial [Flavobacterium sp.]
MKFLGNVLAVIVGMFIFSVMAFFFMVLIAAVAGSGDDGVNVSSNSVIELDLGSVNYDYAGKSNYKDLEFFNKVRHNGLSDII